MPDRAFRALALSAVKTLVHTGVVSNCLNPTFAVWMLIEEKFSRLIPKSDCAGVLMNGCASVNVCLAFVIVFPFKLLL